MKGQNHSSCTVHHTEIWKRPVPHTIWHVSVDGLACRASNTSSSSCTFHLKWPMCARGKNAPVYLKLQCTTENTSAGPPPTGFSCCCSSISTTKAIHEMHISIFHISILVCNKNFSINISRYLLNIVLGGLDTSICLQVRMWVEDQGNPDETAGGSNHRQ